MDCVAFLEKQSARGYGSGLTELMFDRFQPISCDAFISLHAANINKHLLRDDTGLGDR